MAEEKKENPKILLLYRGPCIIEGKKPGNYWIKLSKNSSEWPDSAEKLGESVMSAWGTKNWPSPSPGAIYSIETANEEGTTVYPTTAQYHGRYEELVPKVKDVIVQWQAETKVIKRAEEAKKLERKEGTKDLIDEQMEPIRQVYLRMNHNQRIALVNLVVQRMTRWRD